MKLTKEEMEKAELEKAELEKAELEKAELEKAELEAARANDAAAEREQVAARKALDARLGREDKAAKADGPRQQQQHEDEDEEDAWKRRRRAEAASALQRLLGKAEKYTQFLNRKLMDAAGEDEDEDEDEGEGEGEGEGEAGAKNTEARRGPNTETEDGEEHPSKRRKGIHGARVVGGKHQAGESSAKKGNEELKATATKQQQQKKKKKKKTAQQPKLLTGGTLRDYQVRGYKWMVGLYENGLHGILADEMGLGKTVQTIALIAHLREKGVFGPFLIVVPLSTLSNWVSEVKRWAPSIPVLLYHGTKDVRSELRRDELKRKSAKKFPVTVTTYDIVCRDRRELQQVCQWKYVIVDEGHRLKNHKCRLFRELNELCGGSVLRGGANKMLLTGTPLQNNLAELWSLLNFLMPEIFDDLDFFQSVFAFSGSEDDDLLAREKEESIVSKLHKILAPFMMRRLKVQVEDKLPSKKEVVMYVPMTAPQREMYQSIVKGELRALLERATGTKASLNNVLMQLRKCSLHPYLHFEPTAADGQYRTSEELVLASGKLKLLDRMLRHLKARGHKVLIFSQFTSMLDILQDYLELLRPEWRACRIDGRTSLEERRESMRNFNKDPDYFAFLLSTRAGGVGINLMAADTVIIFDSDWNPHQDSQAQDRAHRIGQTRDVAVYRLVTAKSVELKILERANSKRKLERVVCANKAAGAAPTAAKLGLDELKELLQDDFTGHANDVGEVEGETLDLLLDREALFGGKVPSNGVGYEIVDHRASAIVGAVADGAE